MINFYFSLFSYYYYYFNEKVKKGIKRRDGQVLNRRAATTFRARWRQSKLLRVLYFALCWRVIPQARCPARLPLTQKYKTSDFTNKKQIQSLSFKDQKSFPLRVNRNIREEEKKNHGPEILLPFLKNREILQGKVSLLIMLSAPFIFILLLISRDLMRDKRMKIWYWFFKERRSCNEFEKFDGWGRCFWGQY